MKNELNTCRKWLCVFPFLRTRTSCPNWVLLHVPATSRGIAYIWARSLGNRSECGLHSLWPHWLVVHRLWMSFIMSQFIQASLIGARPALLNGRRLINNSTSTAAPSAPLPHQIALFFVGLAFSHLFFVFLLFSCFTPGNDI